MSPGTAFTVDGVVLSTPESSQIRPAATVLADTQEWGPAHRQLTVTASAAERVVVVPESINPGWTARDTAGHVLTPITVNGWQQGWLIPAGTEGAITLSFGLNTPYRVGLIGGLALLPLLALLALWPARRRPVPAEPAQPWQPGPVTTGVGVLAVCGALSGFVGLLVGAAALGARYLLRNHESRCEKVTLACAAGGLILAGAILSRFPWRSVDGYIGHSPWVQFLTLISVATVAASAIPVQAFAKARTSSSANESSSASGE